MPPLVCLSLYSESDGLERIADYLDEIPDQHWIAEDGDDGGAGMWFLLDAVGARMIWPYLVHDDDLHLIAHSGVYDLRVLGHETGTIEEVFHRIKAGSFSDTLIRQRLIAVSQGHMDYDPTINMVSPRHSLAQTVKILFDVDIATEKGGKIPKEAKHNAWAWVVIKQKCTTCDYPPWLGIGLPHDTGGRDTLGAPIPRSCEECRGFGLSGPWRYRYAQLHGVPLDQWPERAVYYAAGDARWHYLCCQAQMDTEAPQDTGEPVVEESGHLVGEVDQTAAWWALSLMASWGPRTEAAQVNKTVNEWERVANEAIKVGQAAGFVRSNGTEDRKAMCAKIALAYIAKDMIIPRNKPTSKGIERAKTKEDLALALAEVIDLEVLTPEAHAILDEAKIRKRGVDRIALAREKIETLLEEAAILQTGAIKYDQDTLAESGDPILVAYSEGTTYKGYLSKYAGTLRIGVSTPITSRPNPIVSTIRTGWTDPPLQQPPKKGGYRECYKARDGWVYVSADYDTIEVASLAQQHIDWGLGTTLRDQIAEGIDLHTHLAAEVYGIDYDTLLARVEAGDEEADDLRFTCKAGRFGFMGGMGAATCVETYGIEVFAKNGNLDDAITEAARVKEVWLQETPENAAYFRIVSSALDATGSATAIGPTGIQRLCDRYTQMCNHYFQHRTAIGAKNGIVQLAWAGYMDRASPFYGARPWLLLHDEVIASIRVEAVQEAAWVMCDLLRKAMEEVTPDVPIGIAPNVMRRWYKGAKTVKIGDTLIPWEPWKKLKDGMWSWEDAKGSRAIVYESGRWAAYDDRGLIANREGDPYPEGLALAKHRAECAALGEAPWV